MKARFNHMLTSTYQEASQYTLKNDYCLPFKNVRHQLAYKLFHAANVLFKIKCLRPERPSAVINSFTDFHQLNPEIRRYTKCRSKFNASGWARINLSARHAFNKTGGT